MRLQKKASLGRWLLSLTVVFIGICSSNALADEPLNMANYLREALTHHVQVRQHQTRYPTEEAALRRAQQRYVPEVTIGTNWDESETARVKNTAPLPDTPFQAQRGTSLSLDASLLLPLGTQVQLGTEQQYGQQTGQTAEGIPDKYQHIEQYSIEITQPLLRQWTPAFNRLPLQQARTVYAEYENDGMLTDWEVLQESLNKLIDLQAQYDRVAVYRELEAAYDFLRETTATQVIEGRATELELANAELELARQGNQRQREEQLYRERQNDLNLSLIIQRAPIAVAPMDNLSALVSWLQAADENNRIEDPSMHPELRQANLQREQARVSWQQVRRDHWPNIEAYYRYEHDIRELLPDAETQSWGLRLSYTFNNLSVRESQRRTQSQVMTTRWTWEDTQHRLTTETRQLLSEWQHIEREGALLVQSVDLNERALEQQRQRLEAGFASFQDVQRQQQALIEQQLDLIETHRQRANTLVRWLYVQGNDPRLLVAEFDDQAKE